jgi:arginase
MQSPKQVTVCGIPFDAHSSYQCGAAKAPAAIREAFHCGSTNTWSELGVDTAKCIGEWNDLPPAIEYSQITARVSEILKSGLVPVCLGGDHSITFPIFRAVAEKHPDATIVHFDAHPDLYDEFDENRHSHACPFARIMESSLAKRLIQIGIRTMNAHQREQVQRFGVEVLEARDWDGTIARIEGPVYVSVDMDVLDPAFAPGVSHQEPGGLGTRELINAIHQLSSDIVGADIVELNPLNDVRGMTARCAAKILKELIAKIASPIH